MIDASIPLQIRPPQFEDPIQSYGKALTLQNLMQQQQSGQLGIEREQMQNQAMKQDLADQQLMKEAYGQAGGDLDKLPGMLAGKVAPKTLMALNASILEHRQKMAGLSKDELAIAKGHTEAIASGAQAVLSAPAEQRAAVWPTVRAQLIQGKHGTEADFPAEYPGDQWIQTHGQMAIAADKQIDLALAAKKETREQTETDAKVPGLVAKSATDQLTAAGQTVTGIDNQPGWDQWRASLPEAVRSRIPAMFSPVALELVQRMGMTPDQQRTTDLRAAEVAKLNSPAQLAAIASDPKRTPQERAAADAALKRLDQYQKEGAMGMQTSFNLSPAALDMLSRNVATGGALPPMGRNPGPVISKIYNNAAEQNPDLNLAGAKADYAANKGSLVSLQKNRDAVMAFEGTALKNLDQFLSTAKGIVDSGSPLINAPLRMVDEKLAGSDKITAFNVARQVAVTEIAKVLSNPGLGGQLSDSARHEVEGLIGKDATLKQIYTAANILKADMRNRHVELDRQLGEIRGRIGSNGGAETPPAAAPAGKKQKPLSEIFK